MIYGYDGKYGVLLRMAFKKEDFMSGVKKNSTGIFTELGSCEAENRENHKGVLPYHSPTIEIFQFECESIMQTSGGGVDNAAVYREPEFYYNSGY